MLSPMPAYPHPRTPPDPGRIRVVVLGCGTSTGVPVIGCGCPVCLSSDPRDKRRRASIMVETATTRIVVDTGPDFRAQMLSERVDRLDGVLYTHAHADHVHGIDDLRPFAFRTDRPMPVYADDVTMDRLHDGFRYVFPNPARPNPLYPPTAEAMRIAPDGMFTIGDIPVQAFPQTHGRITSLGFRFGPIAYSTDVNALDDAAFDVLAGTRVWIVDCLRERPHMTHSWLDQTLAWIGRVAPEQAVLTHMNHEIGYAGLAARLPDGVVPGHDGLSLELPHSGPYEPVAA